MVSAPPEHLACPTTVATPPDQYREDWDIPKIQCPGNTAKPKTGIKTLFPLVPREGPNYEFGEHFGEYLQKHVGAARRRAKRAIARRVGALTGDYRSSSSTSAASLEEKQPLLFNGTSGETTTFIQRSAMCLVCGPLKSVECFVLAKHRR